MLRVVLHIFAARLGGRSAFKSVDATAPGAAQLAGLLNCCCCCSPPAGTPPAAASAAARPARLGRAAWRARAAASSPLPRSRGASRFMKGMTRPPSGAHLNAVGCHGCLAPWLSASSVPPFCACMMAPSRGANTRLNAPVPCLPALQHAARRPAQQRHAADGRLHAQAAGGSHARGRGAGGRCCRRRCCCCLALQLLQGLPPAACIAALPPLALSF